MAQTVGDGGGGGASSKRKTQKAKAIRAMDAYRRKAKGSLDKMKKERGR